MLNEADIYMGQLRKKLAVNGKEPDYLRTLQGIGYMFDLTQNETTQSDAA